MKKEELPLATPGFLKAGLITATLVKVFEPVISKGIATLNPNDENPSRIRKKQELLPKSIQQRIEITNTRMNAMRKIRSYR